MRALIAGDVVGKAGRGILRRGLTYFKSREDFDLIVVNVENAAGGFGITGDIAKKIFALGVDVLTTGNHVWDKREVTDYFNAEPRLLRPLNYPEQCPGGGSVTVTTSTGIRVAVINIQGRVFMPLTDCPFQAMDRELDQLEQDVNVVLVDMHAEATSEKMAMAWYLDGRVSTLVGTHTHVQTADERVFPKGMAYISDLGMCGPYDSVIGIEPSTSLPRFLTAMPTKFETAKANPWMCGVIVEIDENTGKANRIERVRLTEADLS